MARTDPRTLAALAITATHVAEAFGAALEPAIRDALALVARAARGERGLKTALTASAKVVDALSERRRAWKTPAEKDYFWVTNAIAVLAGMAASGSDHTELVLTHLAYGLPERARVGDPIAAWQRDALAASAALSAAPAPARRIDPKAAAAEARALARIAKALGRNGRLLAARGARHDRRRTGDRAALAALLARSRYPAHAAVFAFERAFGGLLIPEDRDHDAGFACGPSTLIGAYACLKSGAHTRPDGGRADLVPIAYTPSDGIAYLDRAGVVFAQDTIEDVTVARFAPTGAAAVAKLLRLAA